MKFILAKDFSMAQYAQALAISWHVMFAPEKYVYPVVMTGDCRHGAGQSTCANCKVVGVRSHVFVRGVRRLSAKGELSGQQAIPNIFGGV